MLTLYNNFYFCWLIKPAVKLLFDMPTSKKTYILHSFFCLSLF